MTYPAKLISVAINRSPPDVYKFIADPENLPKWASGLSRATMHKIGGDWIADSPMGKVKVKFVERNELGVLDHDVTLPSGEVNHNPLRVVPNNKGSEVTFTLFRLSRMSAVEFERDSKLVSADLQKLKSILER
jgi:uncharacterized protein YndB with AHSA1/START domain